MKLSFGPITFDCWFDPGLPSDHLDPMTSAAAAPSSLSYDPWPRTRERGFSVELSSARVGQKKPRYREHHGELEFLARGIQAHQDGAHWRVRLYRGLHPSEMRDQLVLTMAAAGVAELLQGGLGVVLHASTSALDGRAWTLPAPHATGKSTVANLLGPALKISDDLTALVHDGHSWRAGGTNATNPGCLPLAGLLFLQRGEATTLGPGLELSAALKMAIRNAVLFPGSPTLSHLLMDRLVELVEAVPCHLLDFSLSDLDQDLFRRLSCQII